MTQQDSNLKLELSISPKDLPTRFLPSKVFKLKAVLSFETSRYVTLLATLGTNRIPPQQRCANLKSCVQGFSIGLDMLRSGEKWESSGLSCFGAFECKTA
jgi:hypothetical protein